MFLECFKKVFKPTEGANPKLFDLNLHFTSKTIEEERKKGRKEEKEERKKEKGEREKTQTREK